MSAFNTRYDYPSDQPKVIDFDLILIVAILWKAKWRIFGFTLLSLAAALAVAFALPKTYVAQGEVVVRAEASVVPDADRAFYATAVSDAVVATERNVLQAEGLLSRVASQLEFPQGILQPSWLSVKLGAVRTWVSEHVWPMPPTAPDDEAAKRLGLIKASVGTGVEKGSSVIVVAASTKNPAFSASIVNHMLDGYMQDRVASQQAVARNVEVALQERLRQTNEQISESQDRIAALMQQPGLIEGTEIPEAQRNITTVGAQLSQARRDLADRQAAYDAVLQLRSGAHDNPAQMAELLDNNSQSASDLRRQYVQKQAELANMSTRYGSEYGPRAALESEVNSLEQRLRGEAARVVAQRKADLGAAAQLVASLSARFNTERTGVSGQSSAILRLSRERDTLGNLRRVAGTIEDRLIAVTSQPMDPNARVLTRAVPPAMAAFPNKPMLGALGMGVGLLGSSTVILALAFVRKLRPTVIGRAGLLAGPLLGSIPRLANTRGPKYGIVEKMRSMRLSGSDRARYALQGAALELDDAVSRLGARVITITSALPQEGKSTLAVALGLELAKMGRRVLLLHCDLHNGRARYFTEPTAAPPSDHNALQITNDETTNFKILELPTTVVPLEFLQSGEFRELLKRCRRDHEIVLCDTPPVLSVPDALLVTRLSDAVLLISEFDRKAGTGEAEELSRRVSATGKSICGVIFTKVSDEDAGAVAYLGYGPSARARGTSAGFRQ